MERDLGQPTGQKRAVEIDFRLGRTYNWVFHVADVTTPILGVNFPATCNFNINVHNASVTDKYTNMSIRANSIIINNCNFISSILPNDSYLQLLNEFPALSSDKPIHPPKHNIVHQIRTTGGPIYCRPRHLSPHISASVKPAFASCLPTASSRSAARLGAAIFIAYQRRTTPGVPQATTGPSTTSPCLTPIHCLTCNHLLTN